MLRSLAAGRGGGLLAAVGLRQAEAIHCRQNGDLCRENANCITGVCTKDSADIRR
jgi:hypothetical protein